MYFSLFYLLYNLHEIGYVFTGVCLSGFLQDTSKIWMDFIDVLLIGGKPIPMAKIKHVYYMNDYKHVPFSPEADIDSDLDIYPDIYANQFMSLMYIKKRCQEK